MGHKNILKYLVQNVYVMYSKQAVRIWLVAQALIRAFISGSLDSGKK